MVLRSEAQTSREGAAEDFTGSVRVDQQFQASPPGRTSGARVRFEPGARTAWHSHPLGQTLIVTSGVGRVQRWGDPVDEIRTGDLVWIPAGQKHWHGAAPRTGMTHIAIVEQQDGKSTDWMEKVTDEQYGAAVRPRPAAAATPDAGPANQPTPAQRRFPVYLVDQPRRGRASRSTVAMNLTAAPDEQLWFGIFRLGVWPSATPRTAGAIISLA